MLGGSDNAFSASEKTSGPDMSYGYGATAPPPGYDNPNYGYQTVDNGAAQRNTAGSQSLVESDRLIQHSQGFLDDTEDDIYSTKGHVKVTFDEIFNEPQNVTSFKPVRTFNSVVFEYSQSLVYKLFSTGLGVILAAVWGLFFGLFHFFIVWLVHPWMKMTFMGLRLFGLAIKATVRTCVDPWFQSMGLSLSSIAGRFSLKLTGIPGTRTETAIENSA